MTDSIENIQSEPRIESLIKKARPFRQNGSSGLRSGDRLTYVLNAHHEHMGDQPTSVVCQYSRILDHKEQPYVRRLEITTEETSLDIGWVKNPGLILIENKDGSDSPVQLSKEEQKAIEDRFISVRFGENSACAKIRNGFTFPIEFCCVETISLVRLVASEGTIQAKLTVFPR